MNREEFLQRRRKAAERIHLARIGKIPVDKNFDPLGENRNELQAMIDCYEEQEAPLKGK